MNVYGNQMYQIFFLIFEDFFHLRDKWNEDKNRNNNNNSRTFEIKTRDILFGRVKLQKFFFFQKEEHASKRFRYIEICNKIWIRVVLLKTLDVEIKRKKKIRGPPPPPPPLFFFLLFFISSLSRIHHKVQSIDHKW